MDTFLKLSGKLGSQKHLVAVRDAFLAMFPLTMAGAIAVLINVLVRDIPNNMGYPNMAEGFAPLIALNGYVYFGTIAVMALAFVFALGYNRAHYEKLNPVAGGLVSFAAFVATIPQTVRIVTDLTGLDASVLKTLRDFGLAITDKSLEVSDWGAIKVAYAGATGLFTAMLIGLFSAEIYCFLMKKKVTIKMPDTVPPAVNKAFASMIPGIVAIYLSALVGFLATELSGQSLNDLVSAYIQQPLLGLSQGWFSVILLSFLIQLFWFFGLHGHNVLGPVLDGIYLPALLENTAAHQAGETLPYIWTRGSFDAYGQMGGSGVTIAFIIAVFLFSKRQDHRAVAKLSAPMGVFNINEPVTFGIPMVLNPLFVVPWLIVPPICCGIAYAATAIGFIPPVYVAIPWITPPGLYAFLATGGNVLAGLLSLFNVFVAFLIWTPFVIAANKITTE